MIVYSVTVAVDKDIEAQWLEWMTKEHIPAVMNTTYFMGYDFQRLLEPIHDEQSVTYNISYHTDTLERLREYQQYESPGLQKEHQDKFPNKFVSFRTILERF